MKKLIRGLFKVFLFAVLIITGIVMIKTFSYSSKQFSVEPIKLIDIDNDVVSHLSSVIQFPTVSSKNAIDTIAAKSLLKYIDSVFHNVNIELDQKIIKEFSLVYKWQGKDSKLSPILLMSHTDVVPVERANLAEWLEPPFSGNIKDGYLWGRGTMDDKLGVLAILEAIQLLIEENYRPDRTIYLAFGHDEEVNGTNGARSIVDYFKNEGITFEYILDEGSFILEDAIAGLNEPAALIGIAEKGVSTLSLTARSEVSGHSSMPPRQTSIGILSKAIANLEDKPFPAKISGVAEEMFDYLGPEMDLSNKIVLANDWLFESFLINELGKSPSANAIIRTTTAVTMTRAGIKENVLPSSASAKINFRILPGESPESVLDYVKNTIDDDRVIVHFNNNERGSSPSKISSTDSFGFNVLQKSIKELFPDVLLAPSLTIAATDSRFFMDLSNDIYRFIPLKIKKSDLSRIHGLNERIKIEDYKQMIRFYHRLIRNSTK